MFRSQDIARTLESMSKLGSVVIPADTEIYPVSGADPRCPYCGTTPAWGKGTSCPNCGAPKAEAIQEREIRVPASKISWG